MQTPKSFSLSYKILSLFSVIRGYNIMVLVLAQYLAAIFIFSPKKSLSYVFFDYQLFFIVLASVCVVASGYIINNFYDVKADRINRPIKANLDNVVKQQTKLRIYFFLNFLGFVFGFIVSWRAALFFAVYIFSIWFYSHRLKKQAFIGLVTAAVLTVLPFFAIFVHFRNFSKIIFVHASFLFFVVLLRQLIKDLGNIRGAVATNYITFPVKYGERNSRKLGIFIVFFTCIPAVILFFYPSIGYMKYYFVFSIFVLFFIAFMLWKHNLRKYYVLLHNILKIMLLVGILSLLLVDPSLIVERVIDKLN
ncbi:ubiquinone biosynthesis protein UbiA [Polaribacter pacificus]|uniref:Ubiquinone biosynthesis protein UbiA n=1 Tax=Polaribacter pacificus TaxID=1775173 RepID=A0A917MDK7_9FLAO|nr:geranylgeranylglycerol-phosphate geranylgeranyltransferase [Polaribacter pacificus]GGG96825.1 ubiquinone biosynthesis protein UbiA [Polaribacter pacificus]